MNILVRLINRIHFKMKESADEGKNVVAGMAMAKQLYKELAIKAHPDRNPDKRELAEDITSRLTCNKHNYNALLKLKEEIEKNLY